MMTKLKQEVGILVDKELAEANRNYPLFASDHEAIAVIYEEVQEAETEFEKVENMVEKAWACIRYDSDPAVYIKEMKKRAENLAAEAIQVAAMCEKLRISKEKRDE